MTAHLVIHARGSSLEHLLSQLAGHASQRWTDLTAQSEDYSAELVQQPYLASALAERRCYVRLPAFFLYWEFQILLCLLTRLDWRGPRMRMLEPAPLS